MTPMSLLEAISPTARELLNSDVAASALIKATGCYPVQPVSDIAAFLSERRAHPEIDGEENLLITLPAAQQDEVKALVRACKFTLSLVRDDEWSVQRACIETLRLYWRYGWALKTYRAKYDAWVEKQDWVVLVNRAKAPAAWRSDNYGLPLAFLGYCETVLGKFKRGDGKRQAIKSIQRNWKTGRNEAGHEFVIPGYEENWAKRGRENLPLGWSYPNILRQIRKRDRFNQTTRALLHEGHSAALAHLPHILTDTTSLRFLEQITFDDVRMDWLVFNVETGDAEELWLLVARDTATRMVLGFVMHPATVREDGTASHLGARHMKELAADILQTYPLPPYLVHWKVERGTATLAEAVKLALAELFDNRIKVSYTSMIGGNSPVGYREKAKGNSRGKASHESHNRLFHTQSCHLPGQTGARYEIRPADLNARVEECKEIWNLRQCLPEDKRGDVRFPLVVLQTEARDVIKQFCLEQNFRTDHAIEGFEQVLEWFDASTGRWRPPTESPGGASDNSPGFQPGVNAPLNTAAGFEAARSANQISGIKWRKRMESPCERAMRLIHAVGNNWTRPNPSIVKSFLEHTQKIVPIAESGEISIKLDGKVKIFAPPSASLRLCVKKALAYFCSDDPQFIHLTSGDGRFLGTWYQRGRTPALDQKALAEAFKYTGAAKKAAETIAAELARPEADSLADMRAHNAELAQDFVVVTDIPGRAVRGLTAATPVSSALAATRTQKEIVRDKRRQRADDERQAREALANLAV